MNRTKSRIALAAIGVVMLLAFVPTASAQAVTLEVVPNAPTTKIVTGGTPISVPITVNFEGPRPEQGIVAGTTRSMLVTVVTDCDDDFVKVAGPSSVIIPFSTQETVTDFGGLRGTGLLTVSITADEGARGLNSIRCTVDATSPALQQGVADAGVAPTVPFFVTVDYLSILSVKVDGRVTQAGPQKETNFPLEITNFGNSRTRVVFQTFERPENDRWVIGLPDPLVLNADWADEGKVGTVQYTIISAYKTGWNNDQGSFTISMKPEATTGQVNGVAPTGSEEFANVIVRVKGVHVPGFEPLALLGAVIGSALLARRNKDE
jgi:hypothetical protein